MSEVIVPRTKAKAVKNNPPNSCPHLESLRSLEPGTDEGIEATRSARPEYYGRLATIMEPVIDAAHQNYQLTGDLQFKSGETKFNVSPLEVDHLVISRDDDPEQKTLSLSGMWRRALVEQVRNEMSVSEDIESTAVLEELINAMRGHKSSIEERGLEKMLQAGCGTATYTTTRLLELLDTTLKGEGHDGASRVNIIRHSTGPLIKAAGMNINDIDTLVDGHRVAFLRNNFNRDTGTFPPLFKMVNERRMHFSDEFSASIDELAKYETSDESPTIGCPILLNRGQAVKLWEWGLEMGVRAGFIGKD